VRISCSKYNGQLHQEEPERLAIVGASVHCEIDLARAGEAHDNWDSIHSLRWRLHCWPALLLPAVAIAVGGPQYSLIDGNDLSVWIMQSHNVLGRCLLSLEFVVFSVHLRSHRPHSSVGHVHVILQKTSQLLLRSVNAEVFIQVLLQVRQLPEIFAAGNEGLNLLDDYLSLSVNLALWFPQSLHDWMFVFGWTVAATNLFIDSAKDHVCLR
jgi:hypothetical protein